LGEAGRAILSEIRRPLADSIPAAPTMREEETLPFLFLRSRSSAFQRDPPLCGGFDPSSAHYKGRGNSSLSFLGEAGRAILSEIRRPLADSIPAAPTIREEETLPFLFLGSRSSVSQRDPPPFGGFDPRSAHNKGRGNSSLSFFGEPVERFTARSAALWRIRSPQRPL